MKDKNGVEIKAWHIVKTPHNIHYQIFESTDEELVILDDTRNCFKIDGCFHRVRGKFVNIATFPTQTWEVINP